MYQSTKTYGHEVGLSCAFRQWRAGSHCALVHGYAISVKLTFEAEELDHRNWVMDFGALKPIKAWLAEQFDHRLLIARDDPHLPLFMEMDKSGVANVNVVEAVGCEAFAEMIWKGVNDWLAKEEGFVYGDRVRIKSVEVAEHGANSAIFTRDIY